jgi:hypothetical protein
MKHAVLFILLALNLLAGLVLVPLLQVDNGVVEGILTSHFYGLRHEGIIDEDALAIILDGRKSPDPAADWPECLPGLHKLVDKGHSVTIGRCVSVLLVGNALALASCLRWRQHGISAPRREE